MNSAASRDLPMPASPTIVNNSGREVLITRENDCRSIASSSDRPTNGIVRRVDLVVSPSTGNPTSGSLNPFDAEPPAPLAAARRWRHHRTTTFGRDTHIFLAHPD